MNDSTNTAQRLVTVAAALLLCALPATTWAVAFGAGQSPGAMAAAIADAGGCGGSVQRLARELLAEGVAPGDAAEALLLAGCSTEGTVSALLAGGGNDVVVNVLIRVLYVQGDTVVDLVRTTAYAVPGIDGATVDRALAIYLGNRHLPIRDPGAIRFGSLPEGPVSKF